MEETTEDPILEDEAFLRALVENTSEGLLTIDEESRILFANPAIEGILGYRPDDLVGHSKMMIIPERLRPFHEAGLEQYLRTGERHIDWTGIELPALHRDGHEVPVSVSLREHEYRGERLFTGIFTDITDRKRRERQLREQKRELEEFAHVLSHDLHNPLAVARGYVELLEDDHDDEELRKVATALERIEQILDDTMNSTVYGSTVGVPAVMPFGEVVRMAWESVPTFETDLVLPGPDWNIRAHEGRFCQLLENLFRNVAEHAGEDATVRIGILDDESGFYLEDDGPGVPDDVKVRLGTPSGLTRRRDSGYGLQIVQRVADEHDWEMTVTDADGGGARFEFRAAAVSR